VTEDLLTIDWSQVRPRRAAAGVLVVLAAFLFIGAAGTVGVTVGLAAIFVTAAAGDGSFRDRAPGMIGFTLMGAVIGGLAFWSVDSVIAIALILGGATFLGTLAAAYGPVPARRGLFLTLWALLALLLSSVDTSPWTAALAFLVGGIAAIVMTAIRLAISKEDPATDVDPDEEEAADPAATDEKPDIASVIRGSLGLFAVVRTVSVVAAVFLGYWWFSSYPLWAAITVIVVVRPVASESLKIAVERTLGTAVGVGLALVIAHVLPKSDVGIMIAFLVSAFLMLAFMNANYTLFATFLTSTIVFTERLVQADAFEAGWQRLLATAVGAIIAIAAIGIGILSRPREE